MSDVSGPQIGAHCRDEFSIILIFQIVIIIFLMLNRFTPPTVPVSRSVLVADRSNENQLYYGLAACRALSGKSVNKPSIASVVTNQCTVASNDSKPGGN